MGLEMSGYERSFAGFISIVCQRFVLFDDFWSHIPSWNISSLTCTRYESLGGLHKRKIDA